MKTLSLLGVAILAPLAAAFFILTIIWKTLEALFVYAFKLDRMNEEDIAKSSIIENQVA
ncbi:MAG: hypothetical protein ABJN36_16255 [Cyclobacteriaceae bacterium]